MIDLIVFNVFFINILQNNFIALFYVGIPYRKYYIFRSDYLSPILLFLMHNYHILLQHDMASTHTNRKQTRKLRL
jgi:hypothetical protein